MAVSAPSGQCTPVASTARTPRQASTEQVETAERTLTALANDPMEPMDATEPTEPMDATDPTDPIEATDPIDPMDATDPRDPKEAMEPSVRVVDGVRSGTLGEVSMAPS